MNKDYLKIPNYGEIEQADYRVAEAKEFFKSINMWFIEDGTTTTLKVNIDIDKKMILVDTKYGSEERLVFGRNGTPTLFESMIEIENVLSIHTDNPEKITISLPSTIH